jgi:hypothetical protein
MQLAQPGSSAESYYDRLDDRRQLVRGTLLVLPLIVLSVWFVVMPDNWTRHLPASVAASLFLLAVAFRLPNAVRNFLLAYRGAPALSVNDQGLWSRTLSELGWIKWGDIAEVVIQERERKRESGELQCALGLRLRDEAYARLPWSYRVSQIATMLMSLAMGYRDDRRTLWPIRSSQLTGPWQELMAVLDPMFAAKGIPKREEKI